MKNKIAICLLSSTIIVGGFLVCNFANAQVVPDGTTSTTVNVEGNNFEVNNGDRSGGNLFHSFQDFSVPTDGSAAFNNLTDIVNIFSRVTGANISEIDGLIKTNGSANLFLLNPNGIIFGENARLNISGSFIGSTADSILFPDREFSTSNLNSPFLTINAPIGLNFRDNPGNITNRSIVTSIDNPEDFIGLEVSSEETIGLIGGDIFVKGGVISTPGGRIELGSVRGNSQVRLTEVAKGWDVSYEEIENFGNIELSRSAFVTTFDANTGDIEVQGGNISLIEGSLLGINTSEGQAGNLTIIASESLSIGTNAFEENFPSVLFNDIYGNAKGQGSKTTIEASQLTINNGSQITSNVANQGQGVDIIVNSADIIIDSSFFDNVFGLVTIQPGIFAQDGGNITITTDTLTLSNGGQITTETFGASNAGNLTVNATKSVELIGTVANENKPSGLFANVGQSATATGNAGNLTLTTPQLVVRDGAQIGSAARNSGDGGVLTINASESILLTGTSELAVLGGPGRSGIFGSAQPSFTDPESGNIIPTTGNGGTVNLNTKDLTVEQGALISINTFSEGNGGNGNIKADRLIVRDGGQIGAGSLIGANSLDPNGNRGDGGTLNINATESVEITGIGDINGEPVNSSIFTSAQSTGDAGDLTLITDNLTISNGGDINTSATRTGAAGDLTITANSLDLDGGTLTAATAAGTGGNITLNLEENLTFRNESLISTEATGTANGGNFTIEDAQFVIAYPSQGEGNDILTRAPEGRGGDIVINAESLLNIQERSANPNNGTNDIDASGALADGSVTINTPDVNPIKETDLSGNIIETERTVAQACSRDRVSSRTASLVIKNRGGLPSEATDPFIADPILSNGQITHRNPQAYYPEIKPIKTSIGDIYPARGVIKTEAGQIILTAYPTDTNSRTLDATPNCGQT